MRANWWVGRVAQAYIVRARWRFHQHRRAGFVKKVVGEVFVCAPERLRTRASAHPSVCAPATLSRERTCSAEQHARHTCTPNTARCDHFGRTRALYPVQTGMCVAFLCHEPGRVFTYKADEDRLKDKLLTRRLR